MIRAVDSLEPFRAALAEGGYRIAFRDIRDIGEVLIAETPYALLLCVTSTWAAARDRVENAQAALTQLASQHPSPRSWDLYVVVVLDDDGDHPLREELEHDTRYARKLFAVGVADRQDLAEQVLRPLLPLREAARFSADDPLLTVRAELEAQGIEPELAEAALSSFALTREVRIP